MNLVVFDFCDTLVPFQSANSFVNFVVESSGSFARNFYLKIVYLLIRIKAVNFIERLGFENLSKKLILFSIRGLEKGALTSIAAEYYQQKIQPFLIDKTVQILKEYLDQKSRVIVVSGGYKIYIDHLKQTLGIEEVYASRLEYKNDKATGFLDGADCLGAEKVRQLNELFPTKKLFDNIVCVSDSITDLPMLQWGNHGIVISKARSQYWPGKYSFKEVIV